MSEKDCDRPIIIKQVEIIERAPNLELILMALLANSAKKIPPVPPPLPPTGSLSFAFFYGQSPIDSIVKILPGESVDFPTTQISSDANITRSIMGVFSISNTGYYEVSWQVRIHGSAQLALNINGVFQPQTVSSINAGGSQITNTVIIAIPTNSTVSLINPLGNPMPVLISQTGGNLTQLNANSLVIKQLY